METHLESSMQATTWKVNYQGIGALFNYLIELLYLIGMWLGDDQSTNVTMKTHDEKTLEFMFRFY